MKKSLLLLSLLFVGPSALAGVPCSVPFNLTNGSTADASQVMANYNAILACLANGTAESGVNSSITQLLGLTTPVPPAGGGTTVFLGSGVSGTSSNAIVVTSATPAGFTLTTNYVVRYVSDGANSQAGTLNVAGTGAKNFYRQTPAGPAPMIGGELTAGQTVEAAYDGTEYQLISQPALGHAPGEVFDYAGSVCPTGSYEAAGTVLAESSYPGLFSVISTIWGGSGGNFDLPDLRGRATFSRDIGGSNRITVAGGNFDGTVVGDTGGQQNAALSSTSQLPTFTPSFSGNPTLYYSSETVQSGTGAAGVIDGLSGTSGALNVDLSTYTFQSIGSGSPGTFPVLSNGAIVLKCVKG